MFGIVLSLVSHSLAADIPSDTPFDPQQSSTLEIIWPQDLATKFDKAQIPETPALFGSIPFGEARVITGVVHYAHSAGNPYACNAFSDAEIAEIPTGFQDVIFLVDRGGCHFAKKVRNVKNAGGAGAIVTNNKEETHLFYMADDNSGDDINIPSVFISKADGVTIKNAIRDSKGADLNNTQNIVTLKLTWGLPLTDSRVKVDFFTTAVNNDRGQQASFKKNFAAVAEVLGDNLVLQPHYTFVDGRGPPYYFYSTDKTKRNHNQQCTNQGRYCNLDPSPDNSFADEFTGAQVVQEHLRQLCLWMHLDEEGLSFSPWWDYMVKFDTQCNQAPFDWSGNCSYAVMDDIEPGLSTKVKSRVEASGGSDEDSEGNSVIDASLLAIEDWNVFSFGPTIFLNWYKSYDSGLQCPSANKEFDRRDCSLLVAICNGFLDPPDICTANSACPIGVKQDDCGRCGGECFGCAEDECGICMPMDSPRWNVACAPRTNRPTNQPTSAPKSVPPKSVPAPSSSSPQPKPPQSSIPKTEPSKVITTTDQQKLSSDKATNSPSQRAASVTKPPADAANTSIPVYGVVLILIAVVGLLACAVFVYLRRREAYMRNDIDSLLKQYMPMENEGVAAGTSRPANVPDDVAIHTETNDDDAIKVALTS